MRTNGFTLVETLVAVAILSISIAGPLLTANRAIVAAQISRDQLTASYLAQEGIEYIRAMRDAEYIAAVVAGGGSPSGTAWNNFLTSASSDPAAVTQCRSSTCTLDPTQTMGTGSSLSLQSCSGVSCGRLYLLGGLYSQQSGGGVVTPFTRTVQVVDIAGTTDAAGAPYPDKRVVSRVSWSFHGTPYTVTITDHLTPWQ